jgi:hypothetical protein
MRTFSGIANRLTVFSNIKESEITTTTSQRNVNLSLTAKHAVPKGN